MQLLDAFTWQPRPRVIYRVLQAGRFSRMAQMILIIALDFDQALKKSAQWAGANSAG